MLSYIIYSHYNFIFGVCIVRETGRKRPIQYSLSRTHFALQQHNTAGEVQTTNLALRFTAAGTEETVSVFRDGKPQRLPRLVFP